MDGGIEKSEVNLIAFEKTDMLEPGDTQTLNFTFTKEDMASYDAENEAAYVLEKGDYTLSIRSDSHTVIDEVDFTEEATIVYDQRSKDEIQMTNQFVFA